MNPEELELERQELEAVGDKYGLELDVPALQAEIAERTQPVVPNDRWQPEPLPPRWCVSFSWWLRVRHRWRPEPGMPDTCQRCVRCRRLFYRVPTQGTSGRHPWPTLP